MADVARDPDNDQYDFGAAYEISSPIRVDQLDYQISQAHGWTNAGLVVEGPMANPSVETPLRLYVTHDGAVESLVLQTIEAHTPDETFNPPAPEFDLDEFRAVAVKASRGAWLSEDEVQIALRGLLTQPSA